MENTNLVLKGFPYVSVMSLLGNSICIGFKIIVLTKVLSLQIY